MKIKTILIHSGLFIFTFFTVTVSGVQWLNLDPFDLAHFSLGIPFALSVLCILTCHEFGHYFAARFHKVESTLPFYIPSPIIPELLNFGTFGAVIRTKSVIPSSAAMFDIGAAGPIAGFIASCIVLAYGFSHLPPVEFILSIHPDYFSPREPSGLALVMGNSILYNSLASAIPSTPGQFVPPMSEMYHYPFLLAGWFGLFVTAMNLIPVGQLDGGHITYAMFGKKHLWISRITFGCVFFLGLSSLLPFLDINWSYGWTGWMLWSLILFFVVKLDHPAVAAEAALDNGRMMIGWGTIIIFILSFTPVPFSF